jgi:hypothetical protein
MQAVIGHGFELMLTLAAVLRVHIMWPEVPFVPHVCIKFIIVFIHMSSFGNFVLCLFAFVADLSANTGPARGPQRAK